MQTRGWQRGAYPPKILGRGSDPGTMGFVWSVDRAWADRSQILKAQALLMDLKIWA